MTNKRRINLNIWPKTFNQNNITKDIILTIWSKETIKQKKSNLQKQYLVSFTIKKTCYIRYNSSN